jgi:Mrp family chromosome partitioning ATPase
MKFKRAGLWVRALACLLSACAILPVAPVLAQSLPPPDVASTASIGPLLDYRIGPLDKLFDMVIFDGPPIMGLADAPLISSAVGGTVMVLEAGLTGRSQVRAALRRLAMARGHLLGAVLTKFNAKAASYGYGYGYQYDYDYGRPAAAGGPARGILSRWRAPRTLARPPHRRAVGLSDPTAERLTGRLWGRSPCIWRRRYSQQ